MSDASKISNMLKYDENIPLQTITTVTREDINDNRNGPYSDAGANNYEKHLGRTIFTIKKSMYLNGCT